MMVKKNVLGKKLEVCSLEPLTGYFRDGSCTHCETDSGQHTLCAEMTDEFLQFSKEKGNDLTTPRPEFNFPGLKAGDRWCLCASRWLESADAGSAPAVILEATNEKALDVIEISDLKYHAKVMNFLMLPRLASRTKGSGGNRLRSFRFTRQEPLKGNPIVCDHTTF
jgi:uncharacterized protein (DUF2237 family)